MWSTACEETQETNGSISNSDRREITEAFPRDDSLVGIFLNLNEISIPDVKRFISMGISTRKSTLKFSDPANSY